MNQINGPKVINYDIIQIVQGDIWLWKEENIDHFPGKKARKFQHLIACTVIVKT